MADRFLTPPKLIGFSSTLISVVYLTQIVTEPTCATNTSATLIDFIFALFPAQCCTITPPANSDHNGLHHYTKITFVRLSVRLSVMGSCQALPDIELTPRLFLPLTPSYSGLQ